MAEEWRDIPGFEGHYQVSNIGRVRSLDRVLTNCNGVSKKARGNILRLSKQRFGHLTVLLCLNGKQTWHLVHRLVAKAFIPTDDESLIIDHINGIPFDNRVENLRWTTHKGNAENRERLRNVTRSTEYIPERQLEIKDIEGEEWRAVVGFEGLYEVSNKGRVKSLDRVLVNKNGVKRNYPGRLMRPSTTTTGYYEVQLSRDGSVTYKRIHQLVADAFLESETNPDRYFIDHINGIKTDNRHENLRWVTPAENHKYAVDLGLVDVEKMRAISRENGLKSNISELKARPVIRNDGKVYLSASKAAEEIGVKGSSVASVARGLKKRCCGYSFKYVDECNGVFEEEFNDYVDDLPGEEWKPIPGYEGLYCASNMGRIKSLLRTKTDHKGVKRFFPEKLVGSSKGYVHLRCGNEKSTNKKICRIVAEVFVGGINSHTIIEHINGNDADNRVENLRCIQPQSRNSLSNKPKCKKNTKPVMRSDGVVFESTTKAAIAIGASTIGVSRAARGERRTCKGYSFTYVEKAS